MLKDDVVVMKKNCLEDDIEKVKVILGKDEKSIFRLNETAKFIWDNCNGRRISEISTLLFDACVNKESLDIDVISEDCWMRMPCHHFYFTSFGARMQINSIIFPVIAYVSRPCYCTISLYTREPASG